MSQIVIRRFSPQDQSMVEELITQVMNAEFHDERAAYPLDDLRNVDASYGESGEAFFVAINSDHEVVGTVGIKKEDARVALLRRLFVAEPFRNQKVGKKLVDEAMLFCNAFGYDEVIFKATSRMKAAAIMCQKSGFIQRAKVHLGPVELLKFSLLLSAGAKKLKS
ncbi:MAG: GNAT family N-acetyltransferase [Candidatus Omnitrophica bacterium]|nr:GNAT family N-acetyltransferase [Candidatus Omnitrophota bacterium]